LSLALAMSITPVLPARAQRVASSEIQPVTPVGWSTASRDGVPRAWKLPPRDSTRRTTAWSVLASAMVPGTGQAILRQDRFVAYIAIEAYAWARYVADAREGRRARASYRRLASEVARRRFTDAPPIGNFDYYERMEKYVESGAFDAIDGGDLDPEADTTTANGAIWLLARQTFWSDPEAAPPRGSSEYTFAENFYRERAVAPEYRWSWTDARLEYAEFRRTIRRSNNAYRTSLQDLGLVIANHALSTVDAFVTVRLRRQVDATAAQRFELIGSIPAPWGR
jgi:hypothetical protein